MRRWGAVLVSAAVPALLLLYAWLVYRTAWVSEDAFITLRTCDNALSGYGLRWNVAERVQTYTHPLWMFVLLAVHALTGEPFFGTMLVSIAVSCAAVAILFVGTKGGVLERALALGMLLLSKSFVEYSTSGLENPLTHLWIACFVVLHLRESKPAPLSALGLIGGLAAFTRLDTVLLFAPAAALRALSHRRAEIVRALAVAAVPLGAWLVFSVIYYGFPWPNTAYAKLATGELAGRHRLLEGLVYYLNSMRIDPITLGGWLAIALLMVVRRDGTRLSLLAGSALSLAYVLWIGGDFMSGRFFSAPYFMAVACLASSHALSGLRPRVLPAALVLILVSLGERPPLFTGAEFGRGLGGKTRGGDGIYDSRAEFFPNTSLANAHKITPADRRHPWTKHAQEVRAAARSNPGSRLQVVGAIGFFGYYAGPLVHVLDYWALSDPLLARMPAAYGAIGHYTRAIPEGYAATLASGRNVIMNPTFAAYYEQLALVTRGELFSAARWRAIWTLNTGALDERLQKALYTVADSVTARIAITNLTDHREVFVYVWNDHKRIEHLLDEHSKRGARYEIEWRVTASGKPELLTPKSVPRLAEYERLSEEGMFSFSAAFRSSLAPGDMDIHEMQFHYIREGRRLRFLSEPIRTVIPRVPLEIFHVQPGLQSFEVLELRAE